MRFPKHERVIYSNNPLIEVIGQLRFPTILRINSQEPFDFQEKIRLDYPIYEQSNSFLDLPPEITQLIGQQRFLPTKSYNFKSEDSKWQISLNQDSLTFLSISYRKYEEFKQRFSKVIEYFENIYNPSIYNRIGLRYRDLIVRSKLNLTEKSWSELIDEKISSELHNPDFKDSITSLMKSIDIDLDFGKVKFNHGIVIAKDTQNPDFQESSYLLDSDFFIQDKVEKENVWSCLDKFNANARNLFRWSITELLHEAMQPQPIK